MKEQITSFMEKKLSFSLSAYRKNYSTQHVLTNLIEEWKEKLDINCGWSCPYGPLKGF